MYRERCGIADPDDSFPYLIAVLLLAAVMLVLCSIADGLRWLWREYLSSIIFLAIIATIAGYMCLCIRYQGWGYE